MENISNYKSSNKKRKNVINNIDTIIIIIIIIIIFINFLNIFLCNKIIINKTVINFKLENSLKKLEKNQQKILIIPIISKSITNNNRNNDIPEFFPA